MTREQAKENLIKLGVAEPTPEQITNYLNQVNGEVTTYKGYESKAKELQANLENLTRTHQAEKDTATNDLDAATKRIAELEKNLNKFETKAKLAEVGIIGENAEKLFDESGKVDFAVLGTILTSAREESAVAKEKELAGKAGNPGNGGKGEEDTRTEAEKYVAAHKATNNNFAEGIKAYTN